jgi:uncharacterized protein YggT (Ycf19 family)
MMAFDAATFILMAEALGVMSLLMLCLFIFNRYRRNKELKGIAQFISKLDDEEVLRNRHLENLLVENCGIDKQKALDTMIEITEAERALFQRIVQLFLKRDPKVLNEIDDLIAKLYDPYCQLLSDIHVNGGGTNSGRPVAAAVSNDGQARINQQLVKQLENAMITIDEITAEYSRVFSGNQSELELENSIKKMQKVFLEAENRIKTALADLEV